ncbi:site-2 protease family protein [Bacillota bacterium Meth-B3]
MIAFTLWGLRVRVHPALPVMLALAALAEGIAEVGALMTALVLHELGHVLLARALGVRVAELELMPFGGAARLENAWALRAGQMALVALAGPAASALCMGAALGAVNLNWLMPEAAAPFVRANAGLLLFNMLPALPLDGGRVLCGLLGLRMGQARAARVGVMMGKVLAGLLAALAAAGACLFGRLNLSLVLCAAFVVAAGARERLAAAGGSLLSLVDRQGELADEGALAVKWLAASAEAPIRQAIARFSPRALHRVAVYDQEMRFAGVLEEEQLLRAALEDAERPMGQLLIHAAP